jgi:hypothetical protein
MEEIVSDIPITKVQLFDNPVKHTVGLVLMAGLLILSNAGGISGAGSTVPIMLICFD